MTIIAVFILFTAILSGCAGSTPISKLSLPPVRAIGGSITKVDEEGFVLKDDSGVIYVTAKPPSGELNVSVGDTVKVYGNLRSGIESIFDGYVIKKQSGEQIIINNPSPHIGFILQRSFK